LIIFFLLQNFHKHANLFQIILLKFCKYFSKNYYFSYQQYPSYSYYICQSANCYFDLFMNIFSNNLLENLAATFNIAKYFQTFFQFANFLWKYIKFSKQGLIFLEHFSEMFIIFCKFVLFQVIFKDFALTCKKFKC